MILRSDDLQHLDRRYRANLINSIPGYKPAVLVGTSSDEMGTNLAIFNSLVHIGANPPLIGLIFRPLTVPRHTYANIKGSGFYTINIVSADIVGKAHQTSAKYGESTSEFNAVDLTAEYMKGVNAPFVAEAQIQLGMHYREEYTISANNTILLIGEIVYIKCPDHLINEKGHVNHQEAKSVATTGLDTYHTGKVFKEFPYATP